MDPYGIEKVQGNRYTDLTGKIVIQVKEKIRD
jgi:hypothetical protein